MDFDKKTIDLFAVDIREQLLRAIASKGSGHVGGSLSITDTLAVLYGAVMNVDPHAPQKTDRDYIVLSKGHCGPALYATLALEGYFPLETLETLNQNNTILPSHTDRLKTPGIDLTTGSLGQGASLAAGAALSDKLSGRGNYTYLILGDGELDEGQVWEFALFTAHHHLCNLVTLIDANGKQLDGTTDQICRLGSIEEKFAAFGFHVISVKNGNDTEQIYRALLEARNPREQPSAIVLHTVKGAGVRHFSEMANCHSVPVSRTDLAEILPELEQRRRQIRGAEQ